MKSYGTGVQILGPTFVDSRTGDDLRNAQTLQEEVRFMQLIGARDIRGFEQLYDRFSVRLLSVALSVLRSRPDAEEVLFDVFLRVWNQPHEYRPDRGSPATWLGTMVRRKAIDRLRSLLSREQMLCRANRESGEFHTNTSPRHWLLADEMGREVRRAISTLSTPEQVALRLSYFGGLTHEEVARTLRVPLGTAKARLRRSLVKLQRVLGGSDALLFNYR